jgi:hypothetical protein
MGPFAQARYFALTAELISLSIGVQHIENPYDTSRCRPNPSRQLSPTAIFDRSTSSLEGLSEQLFQNRASWPAVIIKILTLLALAQAPLAVPSTLGILLLIN